MIDASDLIYHEDLQIRATDCDFNHHAKPAALFRDLSEAAGSHATRLGVGFEAMLSQGLLWVHARMTVAFHSFPQIGDRVTIRSWPRPVERRLLYPRDFELLDADGGLLAVATSAWLVVDATTHRIVRPGAIGLDVPAVPRSVGLDLAPPRTAPVGEGEEAGDVRLTVRAGYSAVDMLGHVNNSRYVEWICDAFPLERYHDQALDQLQIAYTHEVLPGEEVALRVTRSAADPALWAVTGENLSNGSRAFEASVHWRPL